MIYSIDFTDALHPIQGTSNATRQLRPATRWPTFSLINTKTYEIKAAFSAQGEGNDTKILSTPWRIAPPNRAKVIRGDSQSLAQDVYLQLASPARLH